MSSVSDLATKPAAAPAKKKLPRWMTIVIGIFALVAGGAKLLGHYHESTSLPECDSRRAKDTLSDVFESKKLNPTSYSEIKTLASAADNVRCEAVLPTKDQGTLDVTYRFFWKDSKQQIEYRIATVGAGDKPSDAASDKATQGKQETP